MKFLAIRSCELDDKIPDPIQRPNLSVELILSTIGPLKLDLIAWLLVDSLTSGFYFLGLGFRWSASTSMIDHVDPSCECRILDKGEKHMEYRAGSTATTAFLLNNGKRLIVANVGDSRAVLARGGTAIELSVDHEPQKPEEREMVCFLIQFSLIWRYMHFNLLKTSIPTHFAYYTKSLIVISCCRLRPKEVRSAYLPLVAFTALTKGWICHEHLEITPSNSIWASHLTSGTIV